MPWAIHIKRPSKPDAWHTGHMETEDVREAETFKAKEQAERHLSMCGLYRLMKWTATVRKVSK